MKFFDREKETVIFKRGQGATMLFIDEFQDFIRVNKSYMIMKVHHEDLDIVVGLRPISIL